MRIMWLLYKSDSSFVKNLLINEHLVNIHFLLFVIFLYITSFFFLFLFLWLLNFLFLTFCVPYIFVIISNTFTTYGWCHLCLKVIFFFYILLSVNQYHESNQPSVLYPYLFLSKVFFLVLPTTQLHNTYSLKEKQDPQKPQKLSSLKSLKIRLLPPKNTGMCHKTVLIWFKVAKA